MVGDDRLGTLQVGRARPELITVSTMEPGNIVSPSIARSITCSRKHVDRAKNVPFMNGWPAPPVGMTSGHRQPRVSVQGTVYGNAVGQTLSARECVRKTRPLKILAGARHTAHDHVSKFQVRHLYLDKKSGAATSRQELHATPHYAPDGGRLKPNSAAICATVAAHG
jgi:hypothetical protein